VQFKRRGVETKLVLGNSAHSATALDQTLIAAVSKGHAWLEQLRTGQVRSVRDLAKKLACDRSDVGRTLRLAFLAPDIVEAIFSGRHRSRTKSFRLPSHLPLAWAEQRKPGFRLAAAVVSVSTAKCGHEICAERRDPEFGDFDEVRVSPEQRRRGRSPAIRREHRAFCAPESVDLGSLESEVVEDRVACELVSRKRRLGSLITREDTGKTRVRLSTARA
jgi:hypothetical protein